MQEFEDSEIDSKLRILERELDEMKKRTSGYLSTPDPLQNVSDHAELMSRLIDRTPLPQPVIKPSLNVPILNLESISEQPVAEDIVPSPSPATLNREEELRRELEAEERRIAELYQEVSMQRSYVSTERSRRSRLEGDVSDARRRVREAEAELMGVQTSSEVQISDLTQQLRASQEQLSISENALAESRSNLSISNQKILQAENRLVHLTTNKQELERRVGGLEISLREKEEALAECQSKILSISEERDILLRSQQSSNTLSSSLQQIDRMRQDAEEGIIRLRNQLADQQRMSAKESAERQEMANEIELLRNERDQAAEEAYRGGVETERLKSMWGIANSEVKQLRSVLESQRSELRRLADHLSILQEENRGLVKMQHDSIISDEWREDNRVSVFDTKQTPRITPARLSTALYNSEHRSSIRSSNQYQNAEYNRPMTSGSTSPRPLSPVPMPMPSSRREPKVSPPWATGVDGDLSRESMEMAQTNARQNLQSSGVAKALSGAPSTEDQDLEKELMDLNIERSTIENWLAKLPLNTQGRTVVERKEKQSKEFRLSCVESKIAQIKNSLRKRKLI